LHFENLALKLKVLAMSFSFTPRLVTLTTDVVVINAVSITVVVVSGPA